MKIERYPFTCLSKMDIEKLYEEKYNQEIDLEQYFHFENGFAVLRRAMYQDKIVCNPVQYNVFWTISDYFCENELGSRPFYIIYNDTGI